MDSLPPVVILLIAAAIVPLLPATVRPWAFIVGPLLAFLQIFLVLHDGDIAHLDWLNLTLVPMHVTELNEVWATIFTLVGIVGGVFALHVRDRIQQGAALAYLGSALGVVLAGDLFSLIVFWEIMAVTSMALIMNGGREGSKAAAMRYLFVHVVGGSLLLAGILWHVGETGSFAIESFNQGVAGWLMFIGVAVNAAIVPLHAWLPDAYPESSSTGMVFLGAFTTKTAVYVLMVSFSGWEILLVLGPLMAIYGATYSMLQNDIRRLLAYHIISQVGFMVTAVGVGGVIAMDAVADQAFTHVLWPAVMIMGAGAIMHATGTTKLSELGGLARPLRWVMALYLVGALSISLFPLLVGLGAEELYSEHSFGGSRPWIRFALWTASVGTVFAVAVKLPNHTFFDSRKVGSLNKIPIGMYVALTAGGALSLAVGAAAARTFDLLRLDIHPHAPDSETMVVGLAIFVFALVGSWLVLPKLRPNDRTIVDTDWVYRNAATPVRRFIQQPLEWPFAISARGVTRLVRAAGSLSITPIEGWASLLERTPLGRRSGAHAAASWLSRPPLGAMLTAVLVTLAVVFAIAQM
jgi:multicomponent Na+:H+ antiporter subunit D